MSRVYHSANPNHIFTNRAEIEELPEDVSFWNDVSATTETGDGVGFDVGSGAGNDVAGAGSTAGVGG